MFGIAVASMDSLSDAEKARYRSIYCGLCLELKRRYGQASRACLSFDLAFLAMLYMSLYEPKEESGRIDCILDPGRIKKESLDYSLSEGTSYCADLSVALAYHKCLDDIADDNSYKARAMRTLLESHYERTEKAIPEQCMVIRESLSLLREYETDGCARRDPAYAADVMSDAFGSMLGFLFESAPVVGYDIWSTQLNSFGSLLGRFIYLMDAAVDYRQDLRNGAWNPFVSLRQSYGEEDPDPLMMRNALSVVADDMIFEFEKLPLLQDIHIMRSILYSGVWQKFNEEYEKDDPRIRSRRLERRRDRANV